MNKRWAFVALTLLSGSSVVHCSSGPLPGLAPQGNGEGEDSGSVTPPVQDSGPPVVVDSTVPPTDSAPTPQPDSAPSPQPDSSSQMDSATVHDSGPSNPAVTLSVSKLDFGLVPCGTAAARKLVTVTNTGNVPDTLGAAFLSGTGAFTASFEPLGGSPDGGAPTATLAPGEQLSLAITPTMVPTTSSIAANFYSDTLALTTDPIIASSPQIAITETAQGAILQFIPTGANFGTVPVNTTKTANFSVANAGNAEVEFSLAPASTGSATTVFGVSQLGPVPLAAGASTPLVASYSPTDTSTSMGTITMTENGVLCAPIPTPYTLQGSGTSGVAQVDTTSILFGNFGLQPCGTQATQQNVTITNAGNAAFNYTATLTQGASNFKLTNATGTIPFGQNAQVGVQPNAIPPQSAVTPDLYSGSLSITTTAPNDTAHIVQLHMTAQGIILAVTTSTLSFGGVAVAQTATQQFSITNNGNAPLTNATLQNANTAFAVNPGAANPLSLPFSLDPAATKTVVPLVSFTPASTTTYSDTATFSLPVGVVNCGPAPQNIALSGSGTTGIAVSPTNVNFGLVQCPTAIVGPDGGVTEGPPQSAAQQQVKITNSGAASQYKLTLGLGNNSPFTLTDSTNTPIAQGTLYALPSGDTLFNVVPAAITRPALTSSDAFADSLTVTTTSPADSPHVVGLHETAQGAVLSYTPAQITATDGVPFHTTYQDFTLSNKGNYSVSYTVSVTTNPGSQLGGLFQLNLPAAGSLQQLAAGASQPGVLETRANTCAVKGADGGTAECGDNGYNPPCTCITSPWQLLGDIALQPVSGSVLCSDPPPVMPLSEN